jgi:putative ABC transport system ATP-binding protein
VLADEPAGNLDADTGAQVMGLLNDLVRQRGKSMLVASHNAEVVDLADRIYLLREGTLREVPKDDPGWRPAISRGTSNLSST